MQFGYTAGRQPMGAIETIRTIFWEGLDMGHIIDTASLDVDKAFDQFEAQAVEKAVLAHYALACAIAAVLRALVGQRAWPTVVGVSCDHPMDMGKGARQAPPRPRPCGTRSLALSLRPSLSPGKTNMPWIGALRLIVGPSYGTLITPLTSRTVPQSCRNNVAPWYLPQPSTDCLSARAPWSTCARTLTMPRCKIGHQDPGGMVDSKGITLIAVAARAKAAARVLFQHRKWLTSALWPSAALVRHGR